MAGSTFFRAATLSTHIWMWLAHQSRRRIFLLLLLSLLSTSVQAAEPIAPDKVEVFFKQCRQSSMVVLLNVRGMVEQKDKTYKGPSYKELDALSLEKCTKLKNIQAMSNGELLDDPKFQGCTWGVDVALGISSETDALSKKFKADLCLSLSKE